MKIRKKKSEFRKISFLTPLGQLGAKGDMGTELSPRFGLFDKRDVSVTPRRKRKFHLEGSQRRIDLKFSET